MAACLYCTAKDGSKRMEVTYDKALTAKGRHILHVVAAGEFGGAEAQILALTRGLQATGETTVTVATYYEGEFSKRLREASITTHVLHSRNPLGDVRTLRDLAKTVQPDLIHTHGVRASLAGRLVGYALHIPVITTVHSDLYYDYASPVKRNLMMQLERRTRHLSRRVIAVSGALKEVLVARGYEVQKITVVRNGLDVETALAKLKAAELRPVELRRTLGLSPQAQLLLCVARLHPVKGHDFLLRAFANVKQDPNRSLHLVLVGDGAQRDALITRATELSLYGHDDSAMDQHEMHRALQRVHFLGERHDVFALLLEANAFVLTSQMEALGIAPLEAMLAGLPVIATRVGGMQEIVFEGEEATGILVPYADVDALTRAIEQLFADPALRKRMGTFGQRHVLQSFTQKRMVEETLSVYAAERTLGR